MILSIKTSKWFIFLQKIHTCCKGVPNTFFAFDSKNKCKGKAADNLYLNAFLINKLQDSKTGKMILNDAKADKALASAAVTLNRLEI